jgi:membrane-bound metal-dependent hydrolase YbcI (DUF457 family)
MMAQIGIHSLLVLPIKRYIPKHKGLIFGILLGSILPDADNFAVAVATLTGGSVEGLHRTYTHSLITAALVIMVFFLLGKIFKKENWGNLGLGLGIGIGLHIFVDLLVWFNGVELFWPFKSWVNLWGNVTPPEAWMKLMNPLEFLFIALFFVALNFSARKQNTDMGAIPMLRVWTYIQFALFAIFLILEYVSTSNLITTIYGAFYLG